MISARKAKQLDATTMFTYSHANTPLGQSERAYYLSYFIIDNRLTFDAHMADICTYASMQLIGIVSNLFGHIMPWENCFAVPNQQLPLVYGGACDKGVLCTCLGNKGSLIHGYSPFIDPTAMPC